MCLDALSKIPVLKTISEYFPKKVFTKKTIEKIWDVVKVIFISTILFWYASPTAFTVGVYFGAFYAKESQHFSQGIATWWKVSNWAKRISYVLFVGFTIPISSKLVPFFWAAQLAGNQIIEAQSILLSSKNKTHIP